MIPRHFKSYDLNVLRFVSTEDLRKNLEDLDTLVAQVKGEISKRTRRSLPNVWGDDNSGGEAEYTAYAESHADREEVLVVISMIDGHCSLIRTMDEYNAMAKTRLEVMQRRHDRFVKSYRRGANGGSYDRQTFYRVTKRLEKRIREEAKAEELGCLAH